MDAISTAICLLRCSASVWPSCTRLDRLDLRRDALHLLHRDVALVLQRIGHDLDEDRQTMIKAEVPRVLIDPDQCDENTRAMGLNQPSCSAASRP
jgi:hypothetical protein